MISVLNPGDFITRIFFISFTLGIACVSCTESTPNKHNLLVYEVSDFGIDVSHLPSFQTNRIKNCDYFRQSDKELIACVTDNSIRIYDLETSSYQDTIELAIEFNKLWAFDIVDKENYALYVDSVFLICHLGKSSVVSAVLSDTNLEVKQIGEIVFFPKLSSLVFEVLDYGSDQGHFLFDYRYLGMYEIGAGFERLPPKYPAIYGDGELGEPRTFLNRSGDSLLISLNYSDDIYVIDLPNRHVTSENLGVQLVDLDTLPKETGVRSQRVIARDERNTYFESYSRVFWVPASKSWYRLFIPRLPRNTKDGVYTSSKDRRCSVIKKDLRNQFTSYHSLASGRYFMRASWWNYGDTLIYFKRTFNDNPMGDYYMDRIYTYSY